MSTTYPTTRKLIVRGNRACHRAGSALQWLLPVLLVCIGVITRFPPFFVLGAGYWALCWFSVRRHLKPHTVPGHTTTVTITDDEYRDRCSVVTGIRFWSTFRCVERVGEFWVLRFNGASPMFLPRSALDDAQAAAFEAFLHMKGRSQPSDTASDRPAPPPAASRPS